jgi:hypothetical protein
LTNGESDAGGFEELREFWFNRDSSSAIRALSRAISSACTATNTASSSYEGFDRAGTPP